MSFYQHLVDKATDAINQANLINESWEIDSSLVDWVTKSRRILLQQYGHVIDDLTEHLSASDSAFTDLRKNNSSKLSAFVAFDLRDCCGVKYMAKPRNNSYLTEKIENYCSDDHLGYRKLWALAGLEAYANLIGCVPAK